MFKKYLFLVQIALAISYCHCQAEDEDDDLSSLDISDGDSGPTRSPIEVVTRVQQSFTLVESILFGILCTPLLGFSICGNRGQPSVDTVKTSINATNTTINKI